MSLPAVACRLIAQSRGWARCCASARIVASENLLLKRHGCTLLHCNIAMDAHRSARYRAAGLDRALLGAPARHGVCANFASLFRYLEGRDKPIRGGRYDLVGPIYPSAGNLHPQECAPAGSTKTEPAVTRSERPAISWRATQKRRQTSRTLAERRRPVCCVIGLRPPAGVLHSAFDRPPWPTRRCVV